MSSPTYRYILSFDDLNPTIVHPFVGSDQAFTFKKESDQVFLRKELSGDSIEFVNSDYDLIKDADKTTKFVLRITRLNEFGTFIVKYTGVFYKTDCNFDDDIKSVRVEMKAQDTYKDVLEKMDREFDLIELAPPMVQVEYNLIPIFQFWGIVGGTVTNFLSSWQGGIEFEEPISVFGIPDITALLNDYNFGWLGPVCVLSGPTFDPPVPYEYISDSNTEFRLRSKDGTHRIALNGGSGFYEIIEVSSGVVKYTAPSAGGINNQTFTSITTLSELQATQAVFFGRMLTSLDDVDGTPTVLRPEDDPSNVSSNYGYSLRIGFSDVVEDVYSSVWKDYILGFNGHQEEPTPYGNIDFFSDFFEGEYFTKPTSIYQTLPIQRDAWRFGSWWFQITDDVQDLIDNGSETLRLTNGYKLADALNRMLEELDINLSFEEVAGASEFFYSDPINSIRGIDTTPVITPKSNIIVGNYTKAASRAPIKLSDVLNLYWAFYKCKWHVEFPYLRIEHIEYYQRGMSYDTNLVGADLTTIREDKTNLPIGYKANKWGYDKSKLPAQIRFGWMDNVSKAFKGYDIDIISPQVEQGNIEDTPLALFTSDVSMMQISPEEVSPEGFAFLECTPQGSNYTLPSVDLVVDGETISVINGYASLIYAHENYHKYVLPAESVRINGQEITAESVKRARIQEINILSDLVDDDNIMNLVRSDLGDGLIREFTERTDGSGGKIVIEHDLD